MLLAFSQTRILLNKIKCAQSWELKNIKCFINYVVWSTL